LKNLQSLGREVAHTFQAPRTTPEEDSPLGLKPAETLQE
jgi:hypothetical protein